MSADLEVHRHDRGRQHDRRAGTTITLGGRQVGHVPASEEVEVPAIGYLHRLGRARASALCVGVSPVPADDLDAGRSLPCGWIREPAPERTPATTAECLDLQARSTWSPPLTIFPLAPIVCAGLTCDYIWYESLIALSRLQMTFELEGFTVEFKLTDDKRDIGDGDVVMNIRRGPVAIDLNNNNVVQLLMEFVEPRVYVRALWDALRSASSADDSSFETFGSANERAVWR
jgi:hypothetical protein